MVFNGNLLTDISILYRGVDKVDEESRMEDVNIGIVEGIWFEVGFMLVLRFHFITLVLSNLSSLKITNLLQLET